jgi:hypothetical protein
LTAIELFNEKKLSITLRDHPEIYKIKLSKKSGVPDLDLPGVQLNEKIKDANFLKFSIAVDDSHLVIKNRKKYSESFSSSMKSIHAKEELLLAPPETVPVKKRKCCCFFI